MGEIIRHIAGTWSLVHHPSVAREWSFDRKLRAIKAAGFHGIACSARPEVRQAAEQHGLEIVGYISSSDPTEFIRRLREEKEGGAVHINVQLADEDTPPKVAAAYWIKLVREARRIGGIVPSLEVHRDTCTETPEKLDEIVSRYHDVMGELPMLTWDFSHFAVVKHLAPDNFATRLLVRPELVALAHQFHFRPFNGHHCQVPVTRDGRRMTPECRDFLNFVEATLKLWRAANCGTGRALYACPEMGPLRGGYALSVFPPSWDDAATLRRYLARAWRQATPTGSDLP